MNKKSFSLGILIGGALGAAAALLYSPSSGKELRLQIKETTNEWTKIMIDLKNNANDLKDSVSKLTKEGKDIIKEISHDVKTAVNDWQKQTEPNKERLQEEVIKIQKTLEELEQKLQKNG
ncbi:YtxH domain-containing protein [Bacillus chungangensis]|uniref:Gas vesicle protein n=1 Tax=Bacillus chungangensis TaxID=587633 RepID=A0ABT9WNB8_9BACI|nr:YtxH domain-containing protein [Bacillus chungangensis]MDQ0174787.1 gas vesicle protein [Bacillus chungangensis]